MRCGPNLAKPAARDIAARIGFQSHRVAFCTPLDITLRVSTVHVLDYAVSPHPGVGHDASRTPVLGKSRCSWPGSRRRWRGCGATVPAQWKRPRGRARSSSSRGRALLSPFNCAGHPPRQTAALSRHSRRRRRAVAGTGQLTSGRSVPTAPGARGVPRSDARCPTAASPPAPLRPATATGPRRTGRRRSGA